MSFINIEIKARTQRMGDIRMFLLEKNAVFKGVDYQMDTYFRVPKGRLKLRQGNIENTLIFYERNDEYGPKQSNFNLVPVADGNSLKQLLEAALTIITVVEKQREIYFIGNVKFHLDIVTPLGEFVEIEASNSETDASIETLRQQCEFYMQQFSIAQHDLVNISYSDMVLNLSEPKL